MGPNTWANSCCSSQAILQGAGSEVEQPGHVLVTPRDDGIVGGDFTYYALTVCVQVIFTII